MTRDNFVAITIVLIVISGLGFVAGKERCLLGGLILFDIIIVSTMFYLLICNIFKIKESKVLFNNKIHYLYAFLIILIISITSVCIHKISGHPITKLWAMLTFGISGIILAGVVPYIKR
jgi:hypothetical protein